VARTRLRADLVIPDQVLRPLGAANNDAQRHDPAG